MAKKRLRQADRPLTGKSAQAHTASPSPSRNSKLQIVVKGDVAGTVEAVASALEVLDTRPVDLKIIQTGVGDVSKSDALMAMSGSRLVVGFNVDVTPKLQEYLVENGIEVRLYDVIYRLTKDIDKIARSFVSEAPEEQVTGKADIIATFKSTPGGIIIGCEIKDGQMEKGDDFRVITAMGPAYFGRIASLQIENESVKSAKTGQQVGIKIENWNKAKVGDKVECYRPAVEPKSTAWKPKPGIYRIVSG